MVNIRLFLINKKCHVTTVSFVYSVALIKKTFICMPHSHSTPHNISPVTSVSKEMLITLTEFKHHYTYDW